MNETWTQAELNRFLRCPATHQSLHWAEAVLLKQLNYRIEAGEVNNRIGVRVTEPLDAALVNESATLLYPCYGGLPTLLVDETIELE